MAGPSEMLMRRAETAPLSWDPVKGGKRAWVCWDDDKVYDLGPDPDGSRFDRISTKMLSGDYYPTDAVRCFGRFRTEGRPLRAGDRMLQQAPMFLIWGGPLLNSSTEIFVAEREEARCKLGYVTTEFHHGIGIWSSELTRRDGHLSLHVQGTAMPHSWLFWFCLPLARHYQKRAWRRAVEEFAKI